MNGGDHTRFRLFFSALFIFFAAFSAIDLYFDRQHVLSAHFLIEAAGLLCCMVGLVYLWRGFEFRLRRADQNIDQLIAERDAFKKRHRQTLAEMKRAIEEQFGQWRLSAAERKLAEDLIRGYSVDQIAAMRGKSPNTVRNQSVQLYAKTGMTGRSDLAAFFLQEILGEEETEEENE